MYCLNKSVAFQCFEITPDCKEKRKKNLAAKGIAWFLWRKTHPNQFYGNLFIFVYSWNEKGKYLKHITFYVTFFVFVKTGLCFNRFKFCHLAHRSPYGRYGQNIKRCLYIRASIVSVLLVSFSQSSIFVLIGSIGFARVAPSKWWIWISGDIVYTASSEIW